MRAAHGVTRVLLGVALVLGAAAQSAGVTRRVPGEFSTINAALDASAFGDTVLVAPGTYTDSEVRGGGFTRRSCAFMVDGVVLRSEAGPEVTIIDMQNAPGPMAFVVNCEGLPSVETAVEGFTLTGAPISGGGAWVVGSGKVTFRDCIFRDLDAGQSTGGGLVADGNADVIDCEFVNCLASAGGAILHANGHLNLIGTTIRECGNKGVYLNGDPVPGSSALIEDCVFLNNWAGAGGGLHISWYNLGATVRRCWFEGNTGEGDAGALAWGNYGDKLIEDCVFVGNAAIGPGAEGGAITIGGNGSSVIRGNTFYGNSQVDGAFGGAALEIFSFTIFERNIVAASSGGTAITTAMPLGGGCNVYWGNEEGNGVPLGETDREVDPEFCDPENHDFTVRENSPCVEPGSLGCGQIGAFGIGCGVVSVESESWGRIKARHREGERP